jgi:hypothetical protein
MFLDASTLTASLDLVEQIEKASLRFVTHGLELFRGQAVEIFREESDLQADIGEDITRDALDRIGMSGTPPARLWENGLQAGSLYLRAGLRCQTGLTCGFEG